MKISMIISFIFMIFIINPEAQMPVRAGITNQFRKMSLEIIYPSIRGQKLKTKKQFSQLISFYYTQIIFFNNYL